MCRASAEYIWIPSINMLGVGVRICVSLLLCGAVFRADAALVPSLDFATSYESRGQLTIFEREENTTLFLQEYHDLVEKVGRFDVVEGGAGRKFYYFLKMDRTATIDEFNCTKQTIPEFGAAMLMPLYDGSGHFGPSAWLWNVNSAISDAEEFVLRGIPCTRKRVTDLLSDETVTTYYVSSSNWTSVHGVQGEVPIRIEQSEGNVTKWILDLTFWDVNVSSSLASTFLIPLHIGCPDLKTSETQLLDMDDSGIIYYADEVTDLLSEKEKAVTVITLERTWIDEQNRLIKFDTFHTNTYLSYSEILDFNTGVIYETNHQGVCTSKPIYNAPVFEKQFKGSTGKLKNASEILMVDHDFNYLGQTMHRNIHCNVFEAIEYNYTYNKYFYNRMVFTYFVMTPEYKSAAYPESDMILLRLDMTGYFGENEKAAFQYERDFFDFRQLSNWPKSSGLNIENCFTEEGRKKFFSIYFPVNDETRPLIEKHRDTFHSNAKNLVMKVARISFLRLPYFKMYLNMENVMIVGEMLDKPPVLTGFVSKKSLGFITGQQGPMKKANAEECAVACESSSTMCRGFTFCENEVQECYLTTDDVKDYTSVQAKEGCTIYNRAVMESNLNEAALDVALQNLFQQVVVDKKFSVQVADDKGLKHEVKATKMEKDVHPYDAKTTTSLYEGIYKEHQLVPNSHTTFETVGQTISEEECFSKCLNDPAITCNSFSYCPTTRTCVISMATFRKVNLIEQGDLISVSTLCNVFRRKSLYLFSKSEGLVPFNRGDKSYPGAGADACASLCLDEKDFTCEGFETCDNQCILHKSHILDVGTSDTTAEPSCTHYFLNYSLSLRYVSNLLVKNTTFTFADMPLEECAKMCFDPTLKCRSINYCPAVPGSPRSQSHCEINSKKIYDAGVITVDSEVCHNYERRDYDPITPPPATPATPETTVSTDKPLPITSSTDKALPETGSTAGTGETTVKTLVREKHVQQGVERSTFTGVVIGMLIFGIVFGVLGFLGYSYYRSRRADDGISVRFTKHTS